MEALAVLYISPMTMEQLLIVINFILNLPKDPAQLVVLGGMKAIILTRKTTEYTPD